MAEPQAATEGRSRGGAGADRAQGNGPQAAGERVTWESASLAKDAAQQQAAAAEKAGEVIRDWSSTVNALYARNMSMASSRSRALADYWDELARARQPADVLNAGATFWSRMISDYSNFTVGEGEVLRGFVASSRRR